MKKIRVVSRKKIFSKQWIKIFESKIKLPNRKLISYLTPELNDFIVIIPYDGKDVYLTKEWRISWKKDLIIPPSGGVRKNSTEQERMKQVRNELREEIGFNSKKIIKLGEFPVGARVNQKCFLYLAKNLFKNPKKGDEDEFIEIMKMSFNRAFNMFLSGKLPTTAYTIAAFTLAKKRLKL